MIFTNSFKILFSNFIQFWKILLNKIFVTILILGLIAPFINTFIKLDYTAFLEGFKGIFINVSFANVQLYIECLYSLFNSLITLVTDLFALNPFCCVYTIAMLLVVYPFLLWLSDVPLAEVFYNSMTSLSKVSYIGSYIKKIGKSIIYSTVKTLISVPVILLVIHLEYLVLGLAIKNTTFLIFAPIIMILIFVGLISLKNCLISGWLPSCTVFPCNIFMAFPKGIKVISKRFLRNFSTIFCTTFIWTLIACICGPLSLLFILPVAYMQQITFQMVMFFTSHGMRYYVDPDTILTPKKLEETDNIKKAKNII